MKIKRIVQKTTHHPSPGNREVVVRFIPENTTDQKKLQDLEKAIGAIPDLLGQNVNTVTYKIVNTVTYKIGRNSIQRFEIFIQI